MSKKQQRAFWPSLIVLALGLTALVFASDRKLRGPKTTGGKPIAGQTPKVAANANRGVYVRRGLLPPQLNPNLTALGDRLEKPGKERLTITGTFSRSSDLQPATYLAIIEFPDRLRLAIQNGLQTRVVTFDGERANAVGKSLESDERDMIETLINDAAEHFFTTQMQGQATRFLGNRFRMDDGSSRKYSGPYYEIYQVADSIRTSSESSRRSKLYYFNSDTLLLERVQYQINRAGSDIRVEEVIGDWQKEQGQQIARRIERFENGKSVFVFTIRTVTLSPHVDDGIFASGQ